MSVTLGPINERTTAKYTSDPLLDETGAVVAGSTISTATLTLYDQRSKAILNSRNEQNVNQANGVAISEAGVVTWDLTPADNIIVDDCCATEIHVAVFDFRWDAGASRCLHEFKIAVTNIGMVTS
jgi:hypothetical protein